MCLDSRKGVKIANKNIGVYKVLFSNGETVFRNKEGVNNNKYKNNDFFDDMVKNKAIGFDEGFGFTVFRKKEVAKLYMNEVRRGYPFNFFIIIKEYKIPKGSKYEEGKIQECFVGGDLVAIRCEELIK